jgi:hypothetical protein
VPPAEQSLSTLRSMPAQNEALRFIMGSAQKEKPKMARTYYTLAVLPNAEGNRQWSPQFGDYDRDVVAQELEDTRDDWSKGSKFKIVTSNGTQSGIDAAIDELNTKLQQRREITVKYSSIDCSTTVRKFTTIAGASKFARNWIGDHPEIGSRYAVSGDGIGKIEVTGASLTELFPSK